jgi:hypothetical protein
MNSRTHSHILKVINVYNLQYPVFLTNTDFLAAIPLKIIERCKKEYESEWFGDYIMHHRTLNKKYTFFVLRATNCYQLHCSICDDIAGLRKSDRILPLFSFWQILEYLSQKRTFQEVVFKGLFLSAVSGNGNADPKLVGKTTHSPGF